MIKAVGAGLEPARGLLPLVFETSALPIRLTHHI